MHVRTYSIIHHVIIEGITNPNSRYTLSAFTDANLTYKFGNEIILITAAKEYFSYNTFELYITIVVMHFCSITKRQSTKQQQLHKVVHKTCIHTNLAHVVFSTNNPTIPLTSAHTLLNN